MTKIRAAVIGLGLVGSRFEEQPRRAIWTHVGAYLQLNTEFDLVAAADILEENRARFKLRCPGVPCYPGARELVKEHRPDLISVATPASVRLSVVEEILKAGRPKALILEKPLASNSEERERIVSLCREAGVKTLVNYNRRYAPIYKQAKKLIADGLIGKLTTVTVRFANRALTMGPHALDLIHYFTDETPQKHTSMRIEALEEGEPAIDFICTFPSGVVGRILNHGLKRLFLFEVDIFGSEGRLMVRKNGTYLEHIPYAPSGEYIGQIDELPAKKLFESNLSDSTFTTLIAEAKGVIETGMKPTCDAEDALQTEFFLDKMLAVK